MGNILIENGKPIGAFGGSNLLFTETLLSSNWTANLDVDTKDNYPYIYEISSTLYTNDSAPIWDCIGTTSSGIPTSAELTTIGLIQQAYFSTNGVTIYATDQPTENVVFRARGI